MSKNAKRTTLNHSRRQFTSSVAMAAATVVLPKPNQPAETTRNASDVEAAYPQTPPLSSDAEAQLQSILARYGKRLSDEQKADLRRLVAQAQKASATLRAFPLENSDEPAMIFHIYRSDRR